MRCILNEQNTLTLLSHSVQTYRQISPRAKFYKTSFFEHNNAQDEGTVKPNLDRTAEKFNKTTSDLPYGSKLFSSSSPDNEYQKWNVYTHKNYHKEIINKCKINKPVN